MKRKPKKPAKRKRRLPRDVIDLGNGMWGVAGVITPQGVRFYPSGRFYAFRKGETDAEARRETRDSGDADGSLPADAGADIPAGSTVRKRKPRRRPETQE